jgi:NAD(P)-dependent dehydrogenase (short-subunit alcohol dehydrogenase family)
MPSAPPARHEEAAGAASSTPPRRIRWWLALQGGLRLSQARHRQSHQNRRAELATFKITCNCIGPGYVWTPLVEHQIPETMKARNMTKEQVINDVLLDAQPTKQFVTSGRSQILRCICAATMPPRSLAPTSRSTAADRRAARNSWHSGAPP